MWFRRGWEPASLRQPEWPAIPRPAVSGQTAVGLRPPGRPRIAVGTWFSPFGVFSHELRWGRAPRPANRRTIAKNEPPHANRLAAGLHRLLGRAVFWRLVPGFAGAKLDPPGHVALRRQ